MDAREFKRRFLPCHQKLYRVAFRLMGNAQDAEDMVQEAYLRLWKKRNITQDFDLTSFNVNLMAQVSYNNVGFMAKLSLIDMFQNPMRPEPLIGGEGMSPFNCAVYPLTVGFSICY